MYDFLNYTWNEAVDRDVVCKCSTALRIISGKGSELGETNFPNSECLIFYNRITELPFLFMQVVDQVQGLPTPKNVPSNWSWHVEDYGNLFMIVYESNELIESLRNAQ